MSLYRITPEKLEPVARTTFATESLLEQKDLQRLLRADISPLGDDLMVIAEEYGEWEASNRRIDLFCLSKDAGLVVVEIKRTDDGGHMELQALRYAAMVSSMTLEQVIRAHASSQGGDEEAARSAVLNFLQWESADEEELTGEVRIVLVSADFSTEVTTTVLWLNKHDLDITCVRLRPYRLGDDILIDATQIIPLPEAAEYEVKVRTQEKEKRKAVSVQGEFYRRFWGQLIERSKSRTTMLANRPATLGPWLYAERRRYGFELGLGFVQDRAKVECYIQLPGGKSANLAALHALQAKQEEIEKQFGTTLEWLELPERRGTRICAYFDGSLKSPEEAWPALQDAMIDALIRLDSALKGPIEELTL